MAKEKVSMKDEAIQTEMLNTTTSSKISPHSSPKSNKSLEDKQILHTEYSHQRAQEYLENEAESVDYKIIKQIYEILDKAIYSTSSIKDNIIKAINQVQAINLETANEKKVVILGFLENLYTKCSMIYEEKEVEDTFIEALSYVHDNKELQGFVEDIYTDYFE